MNINDLDVSSMYAYIPPPEKVLREMQYRALPRTAEELFQIRTKERHEAIAVHGHGLAITPLVVGKPTIIGRTEYCRRIEQMLIAEFQKHAVKVSLDDCVSCVDLVYEQVQASEFMANGWVLVRFNKRTRARVKKLVKRTGAAFAQRERKTKA